MKSKLDLDRKMVDECRLTAERIADRLHGFIVSHSTDSVERSVLRLMGLDGVDRKGTPLANIVVDAVKRAGRLESGVAGTVADLMAGSGVDIQSLAGGISKGDIKVKGKVKGKVVGAEPLPLKKRREVLRPLVDAGLRRIKKRVDERSSLKERLPMDSGPLLYVIVATGNIFEDVVQAKSAVEMGADCIAVIRSTAQSLLDYVPYGATTEGFGGTYATQENFRIMREALDDAGERAGRYIYLVNYASGLCMPEIAVMAAFERLDMLLNDSMYGIIFRNINTMRTFVDQHFSRTINTRADIIINTGEDNYLTTADAVEQAHTVLASDFINEQFAIKAGLPPRLIGLGHAFEIDPEIEDGFLMEVAQAQMMREIFPDAPIKYMPPTKHITGNVFRAHLIDMMFNAASMMTGQSIHLLGILTEAIHTPHVGDRFLSLQGARYARNNMRNIASEISFERGGRIEMRAKEVLRSAHEMLGEVEEIGLVEALARGMFADIKRSPDEGKGAAGVFKKADGEYFNPFFE
ncbi:MAG: D-lysine 5,6-aminomutase subunit alpha [Deltaproteobacteria bacterium]|uniref:D-lysine 5,6-aminomutase subunit alpha n=1 Tax=Candidatus Zymogenus saltonus TaxID=2844893 RepID=A0A9D8KAV0_9DELT|nr:D-lysine 5,6-aminomutase subunit alpha [Candidatus Zymogenus saltonus]